MNNYGIASKYDFDNPEKWHTEYSIPLLDEHTMTSETGEPVANVDRSSLEVIAANNNKRVRETGDPATLILGHTDDEPGTPEKPAKGFVVNYQVKPFKRDPRTGQVIYAIHGDFKVRHANKHILEEYPRRSVELWWNKKELDPIALLGGTSPERDLGVVIRNARLKHISILGGSVPARDLGCIQFSRHKGSTIETYTIEGQHQYGVKRYSNGKVGKVMHEFKEGTLHSGSKHGPKVTDPRQAKAIAMSEAGLSRPSKYAEGEEDDQYSPEDIERMNKSDKDTQAKRKYVEDQQARDRKELDARRDRRPPVQKYGEGEPKDMRSFLNKKEDREDSEVQKPHKTQFKLEEPMQKMKPMTYDDLDMNTADPGEPQATDPMIAKLFQTKEWKELMSTMGMMKNFIAEVSQPEGGMGEQGPPVGGEGEQGFGEEPPPPASGMEHDAPGGDPSLEEQDERLQHGDKPVQFGAGPLEENEEANVDGPRPGPMEENEEARVKMSGTSMPGPLSTSVPNTGSKGKRPAPVTSYSRNGHHPTGGTMKVQDDPRITRLEKANEQLLLRLSRAEAKELVAQLENEGIMFGNTPEDAAKGKADDIEYLAHLNDEEKAYHVNEVIRKRYARKKPNPANSTVPGVARYARPQVATEQSANGEEVEFDPQDPQEASDYADCITLRKMSRSDATKFMLKRRREMNS